MPSNCNLVLQRANRQFILDPFVLVISTYL